MSHEVRTPMAAVVGYAEMLLDPRLGVEERMAAVHAIKRNGEHLLALINEVLDLSKIEAERLELERLPCRLWRTVSEALSVAGVRAQEKRLHLNATPVGRLPRTVTTDPTRLRQILDNLLSNAVKFTAAGGSVELRLSLDDGGPYAPRLVVEVEDQGIGMSPVELGKLFRPFSQADTSTTRRYGGTGLGLSICKRLAEGMGGSIRVRSTPGRGSCFTVSLPIEPADLADLVDEGELTSESHLRRLPPGSAAQKLAGRVLLAEDSPDNRNILRFFLERAGVTVEVAENGKVAVQRAQAERFDLVLMDMQMPELDGYTAASTLRQKKYRGPIVALTAHAMAGDEEKCLRAGCTAYLTKPVEADRLLATVAKYLPAKSWVVKIDDLQRRPGAAPVPSAAANGLASPPRIAPPDDRIPEGPAEDRTLGPGSFDGLLASFRRSLPGKVREIVAAVGAGNPAAAASLAHKLKGSAGMYGHPSISETAGLLEDACRERQDAGLLGELTNELNELVAATGEHRPSEPDA